MNCPDLLVLSQLVDGELTASTPIRVHVEACPACTGRLARVRDTETTARAAARREAAPDAALSPGCLTPAALVAWLDPTASERERRPMSAHIDGCDRCLGEALEAARVMARLDCGPSRPVSDVLRARVASRW